MTFRKNIFSYLLWALFTASVCIYHIAIIKLLLDRTPIKDDYAQMGVIGLTIVLAGGIFALFRRLAGKRKEETGRHEVVHIIWEAALAVLVLGAGIFVRSCLAGNGTQEAAFFETASVTGEPVIPIAHGAQYLYVLALRGLFILVGNHFTAGIMLQIFLQALAALVWYFAIRRISGPVAALLYLMGVMLLPASILEGVTYSPKMLYLLLYGIVFMMVGRILRRQKKGGQTKWYGWLQTAATGIGIGAMTYLDVSGLVLLLPVFFLYGVREDGEKAQGGVKRFLRISLQVATVVLVFFLTAFLLLFLDGTQNGAGIEQVFDTWCTLFAYKGAEGLPSLLYPADTFSICSMAIVSFLLLFGIPAFFVHEKRETQMLYFFFLAGAGAVIAGGFHASGMTAGYLALMLLLALMGAGVQGSLQKSIVEVSAKETESKKGTEEETSEEKAIEQKSLEDRDMGKKQSEQQSFAETAAAVSPKQQPSAARKDQKAQKAEEKKAKKEEKEAEKARKEAEKAAKKMGLKTAGQDTKKGKAAATTTATATASAATAAAAAAAGKTAAKPAKPGYIENPMPLPKQHEAKVLDYPYFVATDKLKFDVKVSPDDDFDL